MLEVISKSLKNYISQSKENVPKSVPKNVPLKRVDEVLNLIKKENKIVRVGGLKGGYWEVVDEN